MCYMKFNWVGNDLHYELLLKIVLHVHETSHKLFSAKEYIYYIILLFVETPRKFITAKLSMNSIFISASNITDEVYTKCVT
jgi:hypothetical protein